MISPVLHSRMRRSALVAALERGVEQATMRGDIAYLDSVYAPSFRFKQSKNARSG